jgi:lambda family phage tail tape measure protein
MADLQYSMAIDDKISPTLKKVEGNVKSLNDTFNKLKTVVAGLAFSNLVQGAYSYANAVDQASRATGIAITTVNNFSQAVASLGGNAEKAAGDMIDFVAGLNEAKQGSASAQASLAQVGLTLSDLASLSEQDIFNKTVQGLVKIEDAALRNKLAVQLLGKQFKDLDVRSVADAMGKGVGGDASGIKAAADASRNFAEAMSIVQVKLLSALEPVSKLAVEMLKFVTASKELWSWLKAIGEALLIVGAFTLLGRAIGLVRAAMLNASLAAEAVGSSVSVLRLGFMAFVDTIKTVVSTGAGVFASLRYAVLGVMQQIKMMGQSINPVVFEALTAAVTGAAKAFLFVFGGAITAALTLWNKFTDATKDKPTFLDQSEIDRENYLLSQKVKVTQKVIDANRSLQLEMSKNLRGYQDQNTELSRSMNFSNNLIGVDETRANRLQKLFDLETNYLSQIKGMQEKYTAMKQAAAVGTKEEQTAFESYAAIHTAGMAKITSEYKGQVSEVNALINTEEILKAREKDREIALAAITQQMERQASLGDQIRSAYDKLKDVEFEGAQMKRSPMEQQQAQIAENARKAAREASLAFAAGFEGMDLSIEQATELSNGLKKIADQYGNIAKAQLANLDASTKWEYGWKTAFDKYIENATNAATKAGEQFNAFASNINSAIDNFVDNGKLSFGDLARSIIQDLIKIELKAQAAFAMKAFKESGGFGGLLSAGLSLLGFADGGQPPINKPSVVGENGPELFVPKTAGTIVPNGGGGMGGGGVGGNTYITNNINALDAKSVAQLFAENRKTLFGSVEQARKEVSYGVR